MMNHIQILIFTTLLISNKGIAQSDTISSIISSDSTQGMDCYCFPLNQIVVHYGSVIQGTVIKIKEDRFRVKIKESFKEKRKFKISRRPIVHIDNNKNGPIKGIDDFKLDVDREYIFILGNTRWKFSSLILRSPYYRYAIHSDSIYIPYEVLHKINFPKDIDIRQKTTDNDSLYAYGYKVSVADFHLLSDALNENYKKIDFRIIKVANSEVYTDPFIVTLLNDMSKYYK